MRRGLGTGSGSCPCLKAKWVKMKEDEYPTDCRSGAGWREQRAGHRCPGDETMRAANLWDLALDSGFSQCRALLGLDVLTLQRARAAAQCKVETLGLTLHTT